MTKEHIIKLVLKPIWRAWYWYLCKKDKKGEIKFLNYGFDNDKKIEILNEDEVERYPLQLYHHIATAIELTNKDVLEVSCGRGGGASYVARYLKTRSIKAIDISQKAVSYCKSTYTTSVLEFIQADAEKLPFNVKSFDVVINIESSHRYPNIKKFFEEVYRVLRPGGYFLYADFRNKKGIVSLKEKLRDSNFEIISREDITKGVVKALENDDRRRVDLIKRLVPQIIYTPVGNFAGVKDSNTYKSFATGQYEYYFYILKK